MKAVLFLLASLWLMSFGELEMKNGLRTPSEKFAGKVKSVTVKEYVRWKGESATEKDTLRWSYTHKSSFDKQGVERAMVIYNQQNKPVRTDTLAYDANGHRLNRLIIDDKGQIYHRVHNKYDSLGNKIAEIEYGQKGIIESRFTYKYDTRGNCIEWIRYNAKGKKTGKHTFSYDKNNNNLEEYIANTKQRRKFAYTYNSNGLQTEINFYINDSLQYREMNSYDEHDNLTRLLRYAPDGRIDEEHSAITQYDYDKTGNWIKREEQSYGGKTDVLTTRKLEYY